jgi:hypothetical protein
MGIAKREIEDEPNEIDWDFDDSPSADPQIQADYEAALGRFLVAFNRVDNEVSQLIATVLYLSERPDLVNDLTNKADFSRKLQTLDLLTLARDSGRLKDAPLAEMRQIAGERNTVAHGHFDQNPFDGEYQLKGKGRYSNYSPKRLEALTHRCNEVWSALRTIDAGFHYEAIEVDEAGNMIERS